GPTVSLLPPSSEQLSGGSASLACLLTDYSPQGALVSWEVDGLEVSQGVSLEVLEKDSHYSWSSSLTLPTDQWRKAGSVTCEATLKDQTPVTHTLEPHHCSQ
uniref:Ig-like domain-containing protein n=1 Tax=Oncorhynchus mykiss TaxID=8022 RepID=A0A8C7R4F5_ONCMY